MYGGTPFTPNQKPWLGCKQRRYRGKIFGACDCLLMSVNLRNVDFFYSFRFFFVYF